MLKNLAIVGASGFGREVRWLVDRVNAKSPSWNLIGFIDEGIPVGEAVDDLPVLGGDDFLLNYSDDLDVCIAVGSAKLREQIHRKLSSNEHLNYPNIVDPNALSSLRVDLGVGNIICAGNIITTGVSFGSFAIVNLACTIGHDASIGDYVTLYPGVNLSGGTVLGRCVELGTGSSVIQQVRIGDESVIGAGAVVVRDIPARCTAVGCPARPLG